MMISWLVLSLWKVNSQTMNTLEYMLRPLPFAPSYELSVRTDGTCHTGIKVFPRMRCNLGAEVGFW